MDIKIVEELTSSKQRRHLVATIFHQYRRIKLQQDLQGVYEVLQEGSVAYENFQKESLKFSSFRKLVDDILLTMHEDTRRILEREYVNNEPSGWWITLYSHSTYYRLHSKAVAEFLSYYPH